MTKTELMQQIIENMQDQLLCYSDEIRLNDMEVENAIKIEKLQDKLASLQSQLAEAGEEKNIRYCRGCGTPLGNYCDRCQHLWES